MSEPKAIYTEKLCRTFKKKAKGKKRVENALLDIDISIDQGEIFGFLGPNGAGKTTLIKILTTLLFPSSGRAFIAGHDVVKNPAKVRPLINMVSGGETSGYGILNVQENIWMFSQFYGIPTKTAKERIAYYLKKFGLEEDARTKINKLSTGMRQKMNIIRGLVTQPKILFLDEPTLGLDVHIARQVREQLVEWVREDPSRTVFLTTHYMAEADELCDRIAIIDKGHIIASDTPDRLREQIGGQSSYRLFLHPMPPSLELFKQMNHVDDPYFGRQDEKENVAEIRFTMSDEGALADVLSSLKEQGFRIIRFSKQQISLEDLFMKIVGRKLEAGE